MLVAVTVYRVTAFTSVGVPLMVQVALLVLKPAGSVGATVQLVIAPPELLKVMLVMAEPIIAIWFVFTAVVSLGASVMPPAYEGPHLVIVPSALMATKALPVE
ncbi:hypothetical protein BPUTEOSOX_639 [thiotrophic endosymbiont of Bathymodiolus puteoserpentis (Logatchev)]|nr:hypothetical protein BPUTEOSOX_639 [thiotrophic endosymbiont of Bathymodiolus puteoserpentis (Logatchev)]